MRSWYPIKATCLDNKRLLGEHNELLIMARSIAGLNKGYRNHPETKRWMGFSKAMKQRHDELAEEMLARGFKHKSPWPNELVDDNHTDLFPVDSWEPLEIMIEKLIAKQGKTVIIIHDGEKQ